MGLYINENKLNIYRNGAELEGNNQDVFIYNHASEMVKEQARFNHSIQSHIQSIKTLIDNQHVEEERKWLNVEGQLKTLEQFNKKQVVMEQELLDQLTKLEMEQSATRNQLEKGRLKETELQEKWSRMSSNHQQLLQKLENISKENEQLSNSVNKQLEMQESIMNQLDSQEEANKKFEKRLDSQEALTAKVMRQLDYFRSILFERTNYLSDKIEEASNYLSQFLKNDELPSAKFFLREKQKQGK